MVLHKDAQIETQPLKYEDMEMPKAGKGEIIIKVGACGVCRSNLHVIEGVRGTPPKLPLVPGHEVVGTVTEIGEGVTKFEIGDRVGVQPQYNRCGKCRYCLSGVENVCADHKRLGWSVDGGYAEYMRATEEYSFPVPDNIDDTEAAPLFCPGITAYRAVNRAEPYPGKKIAVFGAGGVGHMAVQFAKLAGAEVIAVNRNPKHAKLALEVGADDAIALDEDSEKLKKLEVEASIVFAPSDAAISNAMQATSKNGIIVLGVEGNINNFRYGEQVIKGTLVGTRADTENVVRLASKGLIKAKYKEAKLNTANEVLKDMKDYKIEGRIVLKP